MISDSISPVDNSGARFISTTFIQTLSTNEEVGDGVITSHYGKVIGRENLVKSTCSSRGFVLTQLCMSWST